MVAVVGHEGCVILRTTQCESCVHCLRPLNFGVTATVPPESQWYVLERHCILQLYLLF